MYENPDIHVMGKPRYILSDIHVMGTPRYILSDIHAMGKPATGCRSNIKFIVVIVNVMVIYIYIYICVFICVIGVYRKPHRIPRNIISINIFRN